MTTSCEQNRQRMAAALAAATLMAGAGCDVRVANVSYGVVGNAIEHKTAEHDGERVVVRLDNGASIAVVQAGSSGVRLGAVCAS